MSSIENGITSSALNRTAESSSAGDRSGMSISRMMARSPATPTLTWRWLNRPSRHRRSMASASWPRSRTSPAMTHPGCRPTWPKFSMAGSRPSSMDNSTARTALVPMSRPILRCAIRLFQPPRGLWVSHEREGSACLIPLGEPLFRRTVGRLPGDGLNFTGGGLENRGLSAGPTRPSPVSLAIP